MESNSIPFIFFIKSIHQFFNKFSSLCSHPLFSTIVALYTLILLYAPSFFLSILLSPILNSTGIILLSLLRLGANERLGKESSDQESIIIDTIANERNLGLYFVDQTQTHVECKAKMDFGLESNHNHVESKPIFGLDQTSNHMNVEHEHDLDLESNSADDYHKWEFLDTDSMEMDSKQVDTTRKFLEWNVKAPLEIIYEAYEGEEEDDNESNENNMINNDNNGAGCERYPSLSMYYPESETDSSSDGGFPMNVNFETHESMFFGWQDEENDREELIEISLDRYGKRSIEFCHYEDDNLIEIDIFPTKS